MSNCYYKIRLIMQNGIDIISEWRFKGMVSKLKERENGAFECGDR